MNPMISYWFQGRKTSDHCASEFTLWSKAKNVHEWLLFSKEIYTEKAESQEIFCFSIKKWHFYYLLISSLHHANRQFFLKSSIGIYVSKKFLKNMMIKKKEYADWQNV